MTVDLYTQAWAEAEASCPAGEIMFDTFEFRSDAFDDPLRIVSDLEEAGQEFRLEDDAPVDGGDMVLFQACPVEADLKIFDPEEMPQIVLSVDNVGREMTPYVSDAVKNRTPIILRYRGYLDSDRQNVGYGPLEMEIRGSLITGSRFTATASLLPLQKIIFPNKTYDRATFPALITQF